MKGIKIIMLIIGVLLLLIFAGISYAKSRNWVCEYCGQRVNADNMPGVQGCLKNPFGQKAHRWKEMESARNRNWVCEYCGQRVNADNMPGVQGCLKNPFGQKAHLWKAMN